MRTPGEVRLRRAAALASLGVTLWALTACSLGPQRLPGNRMDYNLTVQRSNNEELLVNLVRAKYFEHPFFLQIGAITSQFNYTASAQISGQVFEKNLLTSTNVLSPSLGGSAAETPTVTYAPVSGAENVRKLLTEFGLDAFVLLARATVPMVMHFRDLAEFEGAEGLLGVKAEQRRDSRGRLLLTARLLPFRDLSLISPRGEGEPVVPIRLRSLIEVLYFLAWGVEVPEADLVEGVARRYVSRLGRISDLRPFTRDLLDIHSAAARPADAYVGVWYRGLWYFIADNDLMSKEVLSIVAALYDLQSKETQRLQPVLTLPVSR